MYERMLTCVDEFELICDCLNWSGVVEAECRDAFWVISNFVRF